MANVLTVANSSERSARLLALGAADTYRGQGRSPALPADLGSAAQLPLTKTAMPISVDGLQLREMRRRLHALHLRPSNTRAKQWHDLVVNDYRPLVTKVADRRRQPKWSDCVELAEIIWQALDKEWTGDDVYGKGHPCVGEQIGVLRTGEDFGARAYWCQEAIVALVEAVLTLGQGERFDFRTSTGLFSSEQPDSPRVPIHYGPGAPRHE